MKVLYKDNDYEVLIPTNGKEKNALLDKIAYYERSDEIYIPVFIEKKTGKPTTVMVKYDIKNEIPEIIYYEESKKNKKIGIEDVVEYVPLNVLKVAFKFFKNIEKKVDSIRFKTILGQKINSLNSYNFNFPTENDFVKINKITDEPVIQITINDKKILIKIDSILNKGGSNFNIKGKIIIPDTIEKDFNTDIEIESKNGVLGFIAHLVYSVENEVHKYAPPKGYSPFTLNRAGYGSKSFTFEKNGKRTIQFTDYIKNKVENKECATIKGFLESINKPTYSGYLSSFFSAIYHAKIVDRFKNPSGSPKYCYVLGKNYNAWQEGKLKKIRG